MAAFQTLVYETVEEHIVRLTLNRPEKLNALSIALMEELDAALDQFEADHQASVLIFRGAGRAFSVGYDLQPTQVPSADRIFGAGPDRIAMQKLVSRWQRLWSLPKPTIAQVHGYCLSGGTELIGHCDIVFAGDDALFGHPAGRSLGVLPTLGLWPVLVGPRKAKEYMFTGDYMNAAEALEWHLVNRVFAKDQLEAATLDYARRVAKVPLDLLLLHKASINRYLEVTGFRAAEQSCADLDTIAHQTQAVKQWLKTSREQGLKTALSERDKDFRDKK